jgi:hypothetical protein
MIALDPINLADGSTVKLKAGQVYTLAKGKDFACNLIKDGDGANPIIRYNGGRDTDCLKIPRDKSAALFNVDFDLPIGRTYAVSSQGSFDGQNMTVRSTGGASGGGGLFKATGATGINRLVKPVLFGPFDGYGIYIGPLAVEKTLNGGTASPTNPITSYTQTPTQSVELIEANIGGGSVNESLMRVHACLKFHSQKGFYDNAWSKKATFRYHDGGVFICEDDRYLNADGDVGPLQEDDGGIKMDPVWQGPKRAFYDALRLASISFIRCKMVTGYIKLNAGIQAMSWADCDVTGLKGGSLFQCPFPYMTRPRSEGTWTACNLKYTGANPRLFSADDGAKQFKITAGVPPVPVVPFAATTFNGSAVVK